jgi:hypothetical protein
MPDVEHLGLDDLAAAEHQQLARQRRGAVGGAADLLHVVAHRMVGRELALGEADAGEDDRQQVVEVVGHASGELADALQALGLRQPLLELGALLGAAAALRDVGGDGHDRGHRAVAVAQRELDDEEGVRRVAVGLGDVDHRLVRLAGRRDALVDRAVIRPARGREDLLGRASVGRLGGNAEELLPAPVDEQVAVLEVLDDDQGGRVVDDRLQPLLAGAALGLGTAPLGDVDELVEEVQGALAVAVHQRDVDERVNDLAFATEIALLDGERAPAARQKLGDERVVDGAVAGVAELAQPRGAQLLLGTSEDL